jgi:dihydroflavonol-4-reductase
MTTRRDVVDALIKAMERGVTGERYIVNTLNLLYRELTARVSAVVGAPPPLLRAPDWLLRAAAYPATAYAMLLRDPLRGPFLVRENVPLLTRLTYYDQGKAVRELGISQSPLEEAIREVDQWCEARAQC